MKYKLVKKLTTGGQANIYLCQRTTDKETLIYKSIPCKDVDEANFSLQGKFFKI